MPKIKVVFYREADGSVPVFDWLITDVLRKDKKLFAWCFDAIEVLSECGRELRRPVSDYLRDGIFELRIKYYRENYRILYFYCEDTVAALSHGFAKESSVPDKEINLAVERKRRFEENPEAHTYYEE